MTRSEAINDARMMRLKVTDQGADVGEVRVTLTEAEIARLWPTRSKAWVTEKAERMAAYVPRDEPAEIIGMARELRRWADKQAA